MLEVAVVHLTLDLVVLGLDLLSLCGVCEICETEAEPLSMQLKGNCLWLDIVLRVAQSKKTCERNNTESSC